MRQQFRFYNTLSREVETFTPLSEGRASVYSCGPTVYNYAHIGNLRAYVFVDTLRRALEWGGYQVTHVMNVTDVGHLTDDADAGEDKMEAAARRSGQDIWDLARYYAAVFFEHTGDLGILPPGVICRATDHIPEQIELAAEIERAGYTYLTPEALYFDTRMLPDYGAFARLALTGQREGARVERSPHKRNATDFALWKFAAGARRQMEWDSPWGRGFPGWHLECSAMSRRYLGEQFDIHTGGIDHIPVHHTNEIAQMKAVLGDRQWVRYWMHNNFLVPEQSGEEGVGKMAKSAGDFLTLSTLRRWDVPPLGYRYLLLGTHYRKELRFSRPALEAAATALRKLRQAVERARAAAAGAPGAPGAPGVAPYYESFASAIADDLNTPQGLAHLWGCLRDEAVRPEEKLGFVASADRVLGLRLLDGGGADASHRVDAERVEQIIALRRDARARRNFALADAIREVAEAFGVEIRDTPTGTDWSWRD